MEISLKRKDEMTKATYRDTCEHELRAPIGILTLTAALKDNQPMKYLIIPTVERYILRL